MLANFLLVRLIARMQGRWRLAALWLGIASNVFFIVWTKLNAEAPGIWMTAGILGASFYSIQQIALLIEVHADSTSPPPLLNHALFISFFPSVASGPISRPSELLPQLDRLRRLRYSDLGAGGALLIMGLVKKVFLADTLAPFANAVFAAPQAQLSLLDAWCGILAFTLQIYFDFSGYSDMASGCARMFGVKLPMNFNSPLRAKSVVEFWKHWHMSMTRFLTDSIYTPLAMVVQRRAMLRRSSKWSAFAMAVIMPTFVTFIVIALWHKISITLFAYGFSQAIGLSVNQTWKQARLPMLPGWLAWLLTFTFVVVTLVLLRSPDLERALLMWKAMAGLNIVSLPAAMERLSSGILAPAFSVLNVPLVYQTAFLVNDLPPGWALWLPAGLIFCLFTPNSNWLIRNYRPVLVSAKEQLLPPPFLQKLAFRLSIRWVLPLGIACGAALLAMAHSNVSTFVYFQY